MTYPLTRLRCCEQEVAIMKMQKVGFTYPGAAKATLCDVTVRCNLNSRVAVLGVRPIFSFIGGSLGGLP